MILRRAATTIKLPRDHIMDPRKWTIYYSNRLMYTLELFVNVGKERVIYGLHVTVLYIDSRRQVNESSQKDLSPRDSNNERSFI